MSNAKNTSSIFYDKQDMLGLLFVLQYKLILSHLVKNKFTSLPQSNYQDTRYSSNPYR